MKLVWQWIASELAHLFPRASSVGLLEQLAIGTELEVGRDGIFLRDRRKKLLGDNSISTPHRFDSLSEFASSGAGKMPLIVGLQDGDFFTREVTLPRSALAKADNILALDIVRLLPLPGADLITAWVPLQQASSSKTTVLQLVVRRVLIEQIRESVKQGGGRLAAFTFKRSDGTTLPIALETDGRLFGERSRLRWKRSAAFALSLFLVLASSTTAYVFWKQSERGARFEEEVALVQNRAQGVRKRLDALKAERAKAVVLSTLQKQSLNPLALWVELTERVPQQAWFQAMQISKAGLKVDGLAKDAEILIRTLEASPSFKNVKFAAPVFRDPILDQMRFSLVAELEK
jgi:Tfp pilus assembly protein PilN